MATLIITHVLALGFGAMLGVIAMAIVMTGRDADDYDQPEPPTGVGA